VQEEAGELPETMVTRYLIFLYRGKYTAPLSILKSVTRHGHFIEHVIRFHAQTLYYLFGSKLRDHDYEPWYRVLEEHFNGSLDVDTMVDLMDMLVKANERLHGFQSDGYYGLMNMTLQAARRCKAA
jgi:hypothetical protein